MIEKVYGNRHIKIFKIIIIKNLLIKYFKIKKKLFSHKNIQHRKRELRVLLFL